MASRASAWAQSPVYRASPISSKHPSYSHSNSSRRKGPANQRLALRLEKRKCSTGSKGWFAVCSSDGANSSTKRRRMIYSKDDGTRTPKYMTFGVRSPERGDCYTYEYKVLMVVEDSAC
ncbi:conserved hypothetical protein [Coccidioides posadasii str. Silveira]|uniref:Uncharacterized protein n=2 Tax=Coccidioides posadasii TaxID=199306 RepID=E9DF03_COCPS|nr:conserved hypothetical protein [Coccidioides posadasii str. Silveira]KMM69023.1 hypothetical protein CPAG_05346 [Coccidioides posadasii RMSCC 3488]